MGRNSSDGVLIMFLSAIVPEKSRGNKKCDKEEEEGHIFGLFGIAACKNGRDMVVCNCFDICMFILSSTARWRQYLTNSAFLSFFCRGCQK